MQEIISQIKKDIKKNLLPRLKLFRDFKIKIIYKKEDYLGYYKGGTFKRPIIKLNMTCIKNSLKDYSLPIYDVIHTTILHEIAHAIQEYKYKCLDEEEAEDFAYNYFHFGEILKI